MSKSRDTSPTDEIPKPNIPSRCTWNIAQAGKSPHHHVTPVADAKIHADVLQTIGHTPMIKLSKIPLEYDIKCNVVAKCEFFNPGGSVKDRIGIRMIEEAERTGRLKSGDTIIEPTSGNTGIAVALACAVKGYKCIIVMPEKMSAEKALILKSLGAEIFRTPDDVAFDSPESHISVAQDLNNKTPNSILLDQYRNPGNPLVHYDTTAEEILEQCDNKIDMVVLGCGTGGTITGVGRKLKDKCPNCKIIGVEPYGSVLSDDRDSICKDLPECFEVEGIGYDFIPTVLDRAVVDDWIKVHDKDTFNMARKLIREEGLLCGGSSGSVVFAAMKAAQNLKEGQVCVVLLADGVRNYMSKFLTDQWMIERDFLNTDKKMRVMHWWWDYRVCSLKMADPQTILLSASYQDAVQMMCTEGYRQLTVVDDHGTIKGVVAIENVMEKLANGVNLTDFSVSDVLEKKFEKVTMNTTLGRLFMLLSNSSFVLVVHNQSIYGGRENVQEKEVLIGTVTKLDLIKFIVNEEYSKIKTSSASPTHLDREYND